MGWFAIILGIILIAVSDKLQPQKIRKTKFLIVVESIAGILWILGLILVFKEKGLGNALMAFLVSGALAAIFGVKKN